MPTFDAHLWRCATRHYRHKLKLADQHALDLKRRLWAEHDKRVTLVNTLGDVLLNIAYDPDDPEQEYCNVCRRNLEADGGHRTGCLLIMGLAVIAEAGRSVEEP